jgi:hypothetical protein
MTYRKVRQNVKTTRSGLKLIGFDEQFFLKKILTAKNISLVPLSGFFRGLNNYAYSDSAADHS